MIGHLGQKRCIRIVFKFEAYKLDKNEIVYTTSIKNDVSLVPLLQYEIISKL